MAAIKIDAFLRALEQSNLLPADLLARVKQRVADGKQSIDPRSVAKWLVDKEYLTLWQANKLLAGRSAFYLGRYKLLDSIGKGGMGVVFKARHAVMDRIVALKIMNPDLLDKPQAVARFNREVKTAAALNHPNIITAHDADCVGQTHFLVMEYADGYDLNQWLLARGPLPVAAACEFALQAAVGLGHAYGKGMVHRDIKPVNLLLTWNPEADWPSVKILDLGLARFVSETQEDGGLTRMGQTIGTPDYIAPEAAENFKQADIRADIFSLGCSLFKLLAGRLPYGGTNTMEKLLARANKPAPLIRTLRPEVPAELEAVVAKMLARDPAERYQTPAEVAAALAPFAASTLGERESLEMFRGRPTPPQSTADALEADADASLEEFFRDFAVAPLREDGAPPTPAPTPRRADDEDIGLAPLDDDPRPLPASRPAAVVMETPPAPSKSAALPSKPKEAKPSHPATAPKKHEPARARRRDDRPLAGLADSDEALLAAGGRQAVGAPAARKGLSKSGGRNVWDSPLLMWSGAAVVLLALAGGALLWANYHQGSAARLTLANDSYRGGNYAQALREYDNFLKDFPKDEQASFARARRGLIQIRQVADLKTEWLKAADTASQVLGEISREPKFPEVQEELASLIPTIAEGLAQQAGAKQEPQCVEQARAMLELVNRYVPKNLRAGQRLQAISASLDATSRQLARQVSLDKAVETMQQAAQSGTTATAYQARRELLKVYPDLAADERLQTAIRAVAQAEQSRVKVVSDLPQTQAGEPASPVVASVGFASTEGESRAATDTPVVLGLAGGSVWGVESATGNLLWRRHVGFDVQWLPLATAADKQHDLILTDTVRSAVTRVNRQTGAVVWRTPCRETPAAAGCLLAERCVVPGANGELNWFELESGAVAAALQLPQPLQVAPVADRRQRHLYQVADHSNLFVLAANGEKCEEVFYLGHELGTIAAPPVAAGRFLIVAVNDSVDNATLHVLLTDEQGLGISSLQQLPLEGHVQAPPLVVERSLYVVTDRGALYLFEIGTPDKASPLSQLIALPARSTAHTPHHFAVRGEKLWVGSDQLTSYTVQGARGQFKPDWVQQQKELCAQPLQVAGGQLYYGSVRPGFDGMSLACVDTAAGRAAWRATLASPLSGGPVVEGDRIWAVTAAGGLYSADAAQRDERSVAQPAAKLTNPPAELAVAAPATWLPPTKAAFRIPDVPDQICVANVGPSASTLSLLKLPDAAVNSFAAFAGGLLIPTGGGQVLVIDPESGEARLGPFQPAQRGGERFRWTAPLVLNDKQFVIADGHSKLYRVEIQPRPQPHLAAAAAAETPSPIVSALGVVEDVVCGATESGQLLRFRLPGLEPLEPLPVAGNVVLGPVAVGNQLLLATDRDELICVDPQGKIRWQVALPAGPLASVPIEFDGSLWGASRRGKVWRFDPQTGAEQATIEVGETLNAGPVLAGARLLLSASDGTLLVILPF
ncbi:MAG: protein kinase [Planctomycetaceae bacterium]|nr:protein kinase [Planctomycetaceae bacterium]